MLPLVIAMLLCVALAAAVVAVVAVPARRDGRDVLTEQGEQLAQKVAERGDAVVAAARSAAKVGPGRHQA